LSGKRLSGKRLVRESDCPGKVLSGKRLVREMSCPGNVCPGNVCKATAQVAAKYTTYFLRYKSLNVELEDLSFQ